MLKFNKYVLISVLISVFLILTLSILASTPPYISTSDSERESVPEKLPKIYLENNSRTANVPANITVQKIADLKAAVTSFKNYFIDKMSSYEDTYIDSSSIVDDNVDIITANNSKITDYKNNVGVTVASSLNDLYNKINNGQSGATYRLANLNTNKNLTFGSSEKSVNIIIDNLSFESSNRSITVYGNLIILSSLDTKNTNFYINKTSSTDGNLLIACSSTVNSYSEFNIENNFYVSEDFTLTCQFNITSGSFTAGKNLNFAGNASTLYVTNNIYIQGDFKITQLTDIIGKNLIVNGGVTNSAWSTSFDITETIYINDNFQLTGRADITAKDLIVTENLINASNDTDINITNNLYVFNELRMDQMMSASASNIIIDGSVSCISYNSSFTADGIIFIKNDFAISGKINVTSNKLFIGGNLKNIVWSQTFNITGDIILGSFTSSSQVFVNSMNGDLIIENDLTNSNQMIIDVGGRVAVGGNITHSGYIFTVDAGGNTSSVILGTGVLPTSTPVVTPVPTESPTETKELLIRETTITPDEEAGEYLLEISYYRLVGITKEQIIISDSGENVIKTIDIDPAIQGMPDSNGYVTFSNLSFNTNSDSVSIVVKGSIETVTYIGGSGNGNGKPYFTTNILERQTVSSATSTIYVDHSSNTTMPASINKISLKFLRKAIYDYGKYFRNLINGQQTALESGATRYNDKTIEQIEQIVQASSGSNITIITDNLDLTKDVTLGSPTKSVTLIVENLTANSVRRLEIYGNLIVKNNFNANQTVTIKTNKVNGADGSFYTGNVNYNGYSTFTIANTLYANSVTLNQGGTINASTIVISGNLIVNANSQINAVNDIYLGSMLCNQSATVRATNGDFVICRDFTVNGASSLTVGGRVCVGKRITFNSTLTVSAGGKKTALILPEEQREPEIIVATEDKYSNIIRIDINGTVFPAPVNNVASFSNNITYFAGDSIFYKVTLPPNSTNMVLKINLNEGDTSIFTPVSNTANVLGLSSSGQISNILQSMFSGNKLIIGPVNLIDNSNEFIFKVKLKENISSIKKIYVAYNTLTLTYVNSDSATITVKKDFKITVVSTKGLSLN